MTVSITPFLRKVLIADALFGVAPAILFTFASGFVGKLTAIPQNLLFWAGIVLIAYTALLVAVSRRESVSRMMMIEIIAINVVWAAVSLGLLAGGFISPNALGIAFDVLQALAVAGFGIAYWIGLNQARTATV